MAPNAKHLRRPSGPTTIRYLLTASEIYQQTVKDVLETIRMAIDEGMLVERETQYAQLMMALTEVERALMWTSERCRVLLGEQEKERT